MEGYLLNPDGFERVLHEYADQKRLRNWQERFGVTDVLDYLVVQAATIGCLLWHSLSQGLGLKFKGLSMDYIAQAEDLKVDSQLLVSKVLQLSSSPNYVPADLVKDAEEHLKLHLDPWQMARGHDVVHLLCRGLRQLWKREHADLLSSEAMEGVLRVGYRIMDFAKTELFRSIRAWEAALKGFPPVLRTDLE